MFKIKYHVELSKPSAHLFTVTIHISSPPSTCNLHLPNWIPGSYMIRDFVRNIIQVRMWNKNGDIPFKKIDKSILRYLTVKVKKLDLKINYFEKKDQVVVNKL